MAQTHINKRFVLGPNATVGTPFVATLVEPDGTAITGWAMNDPQSLNVRHTSGARRIMDGDGEVSGLIFSGEFIECEFTFKPSGSSDANSRLSAQLPKSGSKMSVTLAKIIRCGPFADALNTGGATNYQWIYEGGGSLNLTNDGETTLTLPMVRFPLNSSTGWSPV